ncbi:hypothetical protein GCM10022419_062570 [Nonomuraea rosea]|uniref:Ricin B lectin domain-containing protein n=1 Tax=Nonomuraea rosea TaxID=638574 RepID=A0ABP6XXU1_9ACTN
MIKKTAKLGLASVLATGAFAISPASAPALAAAPAQFVRFSNWATSACLEDTGSDIVTKACVARSSARWNNQIWIVEDSPNGGGRLHLKNWKTNKCLWAENTSPNGVREGTCGNGTSMDWVVRNNLIESVRRDYANLYDQASNSDVRIAATVNPVNYSRWTQTAASPK